MMERQGPGCACGPAEAGAWTVCPPGDGPLWLVVLAGLVVCQAWLTLGLLGPGDPWTKLTNDEPLVSGRHPLHEYHGCLGATAFCEQRTFTCYDPAFQAGYPKTPVFDSGSRPAELFLLLAGARY